MLLLFLCCRYFKHPSIGVLEFGACPHLRDPVFWGSGSVSSFELLFFLRKALCRFCNLWRVGAIFGRSTLAEPSGLYDGVKPLAGGVI